MSPAFLISLYETQCDLALLMAEQVAQAAPDEWDAVERDLEKFCSGPRPATLNEANARMRELARLSQTWTSLAHSASQNNS